MEEYPPIENHGLIGDLQTAALVGTDGSIDWLCLPRFDSPSVFASLLDKDRGGYFRIRPEGSDYVTRQMYLPGTAILITRFMSEAGVGEVVDFMPIAGKIATDKHRLVRLVRVVRGTMTFEADLSPRFDYGREQPEMEISDGRILFRGRDMTLSVSTLRADTVQPSQDVHRQIGSVNVTR